MPRSVLTHDDIETHRRKQEWQRYKEWRRRVDWLRRVGKPYIYHRYSLSKSHGDNTSLPPGDWDGAPITRKEFMREYDSLPKSIREALANANHPWAPSWCVYALENRVSQQGILELLAQADKKETELRMRLLNTGGG